MEQKPKSTNEKFVQDMLQRSQERQDVKPQTSYGSVNSDEIEKVMAGIKKGQFKK